MSGDIKQPLADAVNDVKQEIAKEAEVAKVEVTAAVVDELKKEVAEVKAEGVAWYAKLPHWAQLLILLLGIGGYIAYEKYVANPAPAINVNVVVPTPTPAPTPVSAVSPEVAKATADRLDASKLFAKIIRHQTEKQLKEEGLKAANGDAKPFSKEAAAALVANLEDDHLVAIAQTVIPPEGRVLDTITSVLQWLIAHREQVKKIVELIIMLLSFLM